MMNLLALALVLTSLAAAGLFSPTPEIHQRNQKGQDTIIRHGHRTVVVEYDEDGHHNTQISISPEQNYHKFTDVDSSVLDDTKEKIKEAASVLPNMGQGLSQGPHDTSAFLRAPRELICDAYGKCKHKISGAMGKAKEKISETAQEAIDKQKEMARDVIDGKKEMAREVGDTVADAVGKAKDTVSHKAHDAKESTKEYVEKAKDKITDANEVGQKIGGHIVRNVSEVVKEAVKSFTCNLGSKETLNSLMGVIHLLGFATAYGLCVWVTFISSYVMSRVIPRQQFGVVQSKIYPVYFRVMAYCIGMALVGHVLCHRKRVLSSKAEWLQFYNLVHSLLSVLVNSIYLEPQATKVHGFCFTFVVQILFTITCLGKT